MQDVRVSMLDVRNGNLDTGCVRVCVCMYVFASNTSAYYFYDIITFTVKQHPSSVCVLWLCDYYMVTFFF